ncbi:MULTISPECIES: universal stress protein [Streptomyces]|uniref:universal stress protein n=1 Tax=Streptomyces TaxID=1883 RepID=UPI00163B7BB2|nr:MULTISPECIES: universal stress protein [Streptomyces]MBC2874395.1 universal stress protein [Streptomyces sp. TYQ1024]UBI40428.1 universal stress protein [Streptomyces mobaraensis]UKW33009.1 universal stress protein [Streptomyces sp. TYQ1024]
MATEAEKETETGTTAIERVVVGVDGSAGSVAALRQGAREAARHGAVLCPVYAWAPPGGEAADAVSPAPSDVCAHWERAAATVVRETCEAAFGPAPPGTVLRPRAVRAAPGPALVALARDPGALLVVGTGEHGPLHRALHGSVSRHCLRHARCPVLVVHPSPADHRAAPVPNGRPYMDAPAGGPGEAPAGPVPVAAER